MAVERVDAGLPTTTKIEKLNDQTLELRGRAERAQFDKVELDQVFEDSGMIRRFKRNVALGNTATTFGQWAHFKSESGYSIWRIAPHDYKHHADNKVYFKDRLVESKGLATTEAAASFDKVFLFTGTYADHTTEASSEAGTAFSLISAPSHFLYIGSTAMFSGKQYRLQTKGGGYTLKLEYYNGAWVELTKASHALTDNTSSWVSDGTMTWTIPTDWTTNDVNGSTLYWVRVSASKAPNPTAKAFQIVPFNSVISLLALSSNELIAETWKWCSFNNSIYLTIRNAGASASEGRFYIASSSSDANKQSFFVTNNAYKADHESVSYAAGGAGHRRSVALFENVSSGDLLFLGTDLKARKSSANTSATMPVRYLAVVDILSGSSGLVLHKGEYELSTWTWTGNRRLYAASGAGLMSHMPPVYSGAQAQIVGYAQNATRIYFDPDLNPTNLKHLFLSPNWAIAGTGAGVSQATLTTVDDTNLSKRVARFSNTRDDAADWVAHVPGDYSSGAALRIRARSSATSGQVIWQARTARVTPPAASDPTLTINSGAPATVPSVANQTFESIVQVTTPMIAHDQLNLRLVRPTASNAADTVTSDVDVLYLIFEYS